MVCACVGGAAETSVRVSVNALNVVVRCSSSNSSSANRRLCWGDITSCDVISEMSETILSTGELPKVDFTSFFGGFVGVSGSGRGKCVDNVEDESSFRGEDCLGTCRTRVLMRDDPKASRNGIVWVSSFETRVVGSVTSSNGNFEMKSRIAALDSFTTCSTEVGTFEKVCGGVVKGSYSIIDLSGNAESVIVVSEFEIWLADKSLCRSAISHVSKAT